MGDEPFAIIFVFYNYIYIYRKGRKPGNYLHWGDEPLAIIFVFCNYIYIYRKAESQAIICIWGMSLLQQFEPYCNFDASSTQQQSSPETPNKKSIAKMVANNVEMKRRGICRLVSWHQKRYILVAPLKSFR